MEMLALRNQITVLERELRNARPGFPCRPSIAPHISTATRRRFRPHLILREMVSKRPTLVLRVHERLDPAVAILASHEGLTLRAAHHAAW